MMQNM